MLLAPDVMTPRRRFRHYSLMPCLLSCRHYAIDAGYVATALRYSLLRFRCFSLLPAAIIFAFICRHFSLAAILLMLSFSCRH